MKKLYFARHGLSEMNVQGLIAGMTETPLTDEGREQARRAGQAAKDLDIHYIICSPLSRAHETALIIAREMGHPEEEVHTNSLFVERHFGAGEGTPWSPDLDMDGFADAESTETLLNRARMALDFLKTVEADNVLVVSHGGFGRALRQLCLDIPLSDRGKSIPNAEIFQLI